MNTEVNRRGPRIPRSDEQWHRLLTLDGLWASLRGVVPRVKDPIQILAHLATVVGLVVAYCSYQDHVKPALELATTKKELARVESALSLATADLAAKNAEAVELAKALEQLRADIEDQGKRRTAQERLLAQSQSALADVTQRFESTANKLQETESSRQLAVVAETAARSQLAELNEKLRTQQDALARVTKDYRRRAVESAVAQALACFDTLFRSDVSGCVDRHIKSADGLLDGFTDTEKANYRSLVASHLAADVREITSRNETLAKADADVQAAFGKGEEAVRDARANRDRLTHQSQGIYLMRFTKSRLIGELFHALGI